MATQQRNVAALVVDHLQLIGGKQSHSILIWEKNYEGHQTAITHRGFPATMRWCSPNCLDRIGGRCPFDGGIRDCCF